MSVPSKKAVPQIHTFAEDLARERAKRGLVVPKKVTTTTPAPALPITKKASTRIIEDTKKKTPTKKTIPTVTTPVVSPVVQAQVAPKPVTKAAVVPTKEPVTTSKPTAVKTVSPTPEAPVKITASASRDASYGATIIKDTK